VFGWDRLRPCLFPKRERKRKEGKEEKMKRGRVLPPPLWLRFGLEKKGRNEELKNKNKIK